MARSRRGAYMQEGNNGRLPVLVLELQLLLVTQGIQEGIGRNRLHTRMDANEGSGNTVVYGERKADLELCFLW